MKKVLSLALALILCFTLTAPAFAADSATENPADLLYGLGLFKGTGTNNDGSPIYDLDRQATRIEALIMLVRLVGREQEALAFTGTHPFLDVPQWADKYVAFAYHEGLARGVSATSYDCYRVASANEYLTFVLRALGYDDNATDAQYTVFTANRFAMELGLADHIYADGAFLRGDVAVVSVAALKQPVNDSDTTLIQSLVFEGAVTPNDAHDAGFDDVIAMPEEELGKEIEIPLDEDNVITAEAVHAVLPQARYFYCGSGSHGGDELLGISFNEYLLNIAAYLRTVYSDGGSRYSEFPSDMYINPNPYFIDYAYILDGDLNIIATYVEGTNPSGAGKLTFTRAYIDTQSIYDKIMEKINASLANRDAHNVVVDVDHPFYSRSDNVYTIYYLPVYIDGKEMTSDYRVSFNYRYEDAGWTVEDALRENQFQILYTPPLMGIEDENGDLIYEHAVLSEDATPTYVELDEQGDNDIVHYCLALTEEELALDLVVVVYDPLGNVLGYTII